MRDVEDLIERLEAGRRDGVQDRIFEIVEGVTRADHAHRTGHEGMLAAPVWVQPFSYGGVPGGPHGYSVWVGPPPMYLFDISEAEKVVPRGLIWGVERSSVGYSAFCCQGSGRWVGEHRDYAAWALAIAGLKARLAMSDPLFENDSQ